MGIQLPGRQRISCPERPMRTKLWSFIWKMRRAWMLGQALVYFVLLARSKFSHLVTILNTSLLVRLSWRRLVQLVFLTPLQCPSSSWWLRWKNVEFSTPSSQGTRWNVHQKCGEERQLTRWQSPMNPSASSSPTLLWRSSRWRQATLQGGLGCVLWPIPPTSPWCGDSQVLLGHSLIVLVFVQVRCCDLGF